MAALGGAAASWPLAVRAQQDDPRTAHQRAPQRSRRTWYLELLDCRGLLRTPAQLSATAKAQDGCVIAQVPFRSTHYLTDGGIFDNLGVAEILHLVGSLGWAPEQLMGRPIVVGGFTGRPGSEPPEK